MQSVSAYTDATIVTPADDRDRDAASQTTFVSEGKKL